MYAHCPSRSHTVRPRNPSPQTTCEFSNTLCSHPPPLRPEHLIPNQDCCRGGALRMTAVGFEPTPLRNGALSHRLRPLGQTVLLQSDGQPTQNQCAKSRSSRARSVPSCVVIPIAIGQKVPTEACVEMFPKPTATQAQTPHGSDRNKQRVVRNTRSPKLAMWASLATASMYRWAEPHN